MSDAADVKVERHDLFIRKKEGQNGADIAIVNFVDAGDTVNYRIKGARRIYNSKVANFLRNWRKLETR